MSKRVSLPNDNWAQLRDAEEVPERFRRRVMAGSASISDAVSDEGVSTTANTMEKMRGLQDALIVALISSWSYESPVAEESLLDLPGAHYDALQKETAPLLTKVLPNFDLDPDPESPTEPSSD